LISSLPKGRVASFLNVAKYLHFLLTSSPLINNSFEDQLAIKAIEDQIANEIKKNISKNKYKDNYNNNNSKLDRIETIEFNIDNALFFQCGVCMDTFQDREKLKRLTCGHIYHKECLNQWIQNNNYCQLCAKVIFH